MRYGHYHEVEAIQWKGDNLNQINDFLSEHGKNHIAEESTKIDGQMRVSLGDYGHEFNVSDWIVLEQPGCFIRNWNNQQFTDLLQSNMSEMSLLLNESADNIEELLKISRKHPLSPEDYKKCNEIEDFTVNFLGTDLERNLFRTFNNLKQ